MCNTHIVKLSSRDTCMYMKPSTILFLFELERCVKHVLHGLNVYAVKEKFQQFVTVYTEIILIINAMHQKKLREIYDQNSIIECELIAYALDDLVYTANTVLTF